MGTYTNNLFSVGELVWDGPCEEAAIVLAVDTQSRAARGVYERASCRYDLYYLACCNTRKSNRSRLQRAVPEYDLTPLNSNNIKKLREAGHIGPGSKRD